MTTPHNGMAQGKSIWMVIGQTTLSIFLIAILVGTALFYVLFRSAVFEQIEDESRALLGTALAVREYTVEEITELVTKADPLAFHPESVPSFAAQSVFKRLGQGPEGYSYRESALNPTNPEDRATEFEAEIINRFRADPELSEVSGVRDGDGGLSFYLARPITIKDPACLQCHTTAAEAPPAMVDIYGETNGFGWQLNETIGAQVLTVPLASEYENIIKMLFVFVVMLLALFGLVFVVLTVVLQRQLIDPLERLADQAERVSLRDSNIELPKGGTREIVKLSGALERLRQSLRLALNRKQD